MNLVTGFLMIVSQFIGAIAGGAIIYSLVENQKMSDIQRAAQFPHLKPEQGIDAMQAYWIEFISALIFVMANLICKDGVRLNFFPTKEGQKATNMFAIFFIAMTLCGMIYIAGPHTGAAVNPAVGLANHMMSLRLFKDGSVRDHVDSVFMISGVAGGICAGLFSWAHGNLITFSVEAKNSPAPVAATAPAAATERETSPAGTSGNIGQGEATVVSDKHSNDEENSASKMG